MVVNISLTSIVKEKMSGLRQFWENTQTFRVGESKTATADERAAADRRQLTK
jgi:hypothetical protein